MLCAFSVPHLTWIVLCTQTVKLGSLLGVPEGASNRANDTVHG